MTFDLKIETNTNIRFLVKNTESEGSHEQSPVFDRSEVISQAVSRIMYQLFPVILSPQVM